MNYPTLLQVNATLNWGSTGTIAHNCNLQAAKKGWNCFEAYGRYSNMSEFTSLRVGNRLDVYEHYIENLIFDNEGLASRRATRQFVEQIKVINPSIIHLHNIHDHWLNYRVLFEYLNETNIHVVWTFHDFWAMTGHCSHFVFADCDKYKIKCDSCPYTKNRMFPLVGQTKRNYELKKSVFLSNKHLTIVPVSEWVAESVRQSFFKYNRIRVIPNGVDTTVFKPTVGCLSVNLDDNKFVIMAVASQWKSNNKGLTDYIALSRLLADDELIVLVGVTDDIIKKLPNNIIGVKRINDQRDLASLYTRASVVCSFSRAETFGLTIIEGYACGTPAVVYDNTAPPKLVTPQTGFVVPNKDYKSAYAAIQIIKQSGKETYSSACIKLARGSYSIDNCYSSYMSLYEEILSDAN